MQVAKRAAPQCRSLQAVRDKEMRPNRPVPSGCCEKVRLRRCAAWQGMALAGATRLASIAFSQQRGREISVNTPYSTTSSMPSMPFSRWLSKNSSLFLQ
jgi:hypothetical protein